MPVMRRGCRYAAQTPRRRFAVTVGAPRWAMQGTLGLADGLPMVIHAR
jgi:hypothetical protein